jgi:hypothetical protein
MQNIQTFFIPWLLVLLLTIASAAIPDGNLSLSIFLLILTYAILIVHLNPEIKIIVFFLLFNILLLYFLSVNDLNFSYLYTDRHREMYIDVFFLETVFWLFFALGNFMSKNKSRIFYDNSLSNALFFLASFLAVIELYFLYKGGFSSYIENSNRGTVLFELSCMLLSVGAYLKERINFYWFLLAAILIIIGILYGKRLPIAYLMMFFYILIYRKYGLNITFLTVFITFLTSFLFGIFRDNFLVDMFLNELNMSALEKTNQGAIVHASSEYLNIIKNGIISIQERLMSFFGNFFGALFVSMSSMPDYVRINQFTLKHADIQGNGGLIGVYSYFFLGFFGPVLLGYIFGFLINYRRGVLGLIAVSLVITSPRWTMYNIGPMIRMLSVVLLVYIVMKLVRLQQNKMRVK